MSDQVSFTLRGRGLDCRACSLGLYEVVIKIEGVEQATASIKDGRVTALFDPEKTKRETIEDLLRKRGVQLKMP
ncbi:MAG: heavy-metal-associated domain-containing protein [Planctomycetes bacterium]|nr:heavy-metal-associated domain-containing protein [Planctomycetota bacterium]